MRAVPQLAWRLLLGSGGRGALTTALSAFAVAIATGLLLLTLGVALGFNQRGERESWLIPAEAESNPAAVMAVATDYVRGTAVVTVDLAALGNDAPVPPGLNHFPQPGEVWLSPALADLVATLPPDQLANRYVDATPAGIIGDAALVYPDQLMVITGRASSWFEQPLAGENWTSPWFAPPTTISNFEGTRPWWLSNYQALSAFAVALLVVPLIVLGTAAGRLATTYRDRRLAAMRLVGATPGQVRAITLFETMLVGIAGALIGTGAYVISLPLAARVEASGGAWIAGDLWVGWPVALATLVAVPVIVCFSALLGLRKLVISPLGVARRQQAKGATVWRALLFVGLIASYAIIAPGIQRSEALFFGVFFGVLFLGFSIMGPFVVRILGYVMAFFARKPATLLAGRRIIDDPHSVWRIVGGITLTGFVAGFLMIMIPASINNSTDEYQSVGSYVLASDLNRVVEEIQSGIDHHGINGILDPVEVDQALDDSMIWLSMTVYSRNEGEIDQVRTIFSNVAGLSTPASSASYSWQSNNEMSDIRTASMLVLTVTLAVASASAMINGVTGVLDRRQTLTSLRLAGTPLSVLDGARVRETLVPFVLLGGGSVATGIFCALPLSLLAQMDVLERVDEYQRSLALLVIPLAVAVVGLAIAEIASRVTLRSATGNPTAHRIQ